MSCPPPRRPSLPLCLLLLASCGAESSDSAARIGGPDSEAHVAAEGHGEHDNGHNGHHDGHDDHHDGHDDHHDGHDDHHDEGPVLHAWFESDRERHAFGSAYANAVLTTRFELVAAGTDPVVVERVVTSCDCAEGELWVVGEAGEGAPVELGRAYAPGTRFDLVARLDTRGKYGDQEQKVHLVLGGQREKVTFGLSATVRSFLETEPSLLDLEPFSTLEGVAATATVRSATGEPFALGASPVPDGLSIVLTPTEPGPDGRAPVWQMSVTVEPGAPIGVASYRLMLTTDVPNEDAAPDGRSATHRREFWIRGTVEGVH